MDVVGIDIDYGTLGDTGSMLMVESVNGTAIKILIIYFNSFYMFYIHGVFFVCLMIGTFGYEQMADNFKRIYWILPQKTFKDLDCFCNNNYNNNCFYWMELLSILERPSI